MYKRKFMARLEAERQQLGIKYASKRTHWTFFFWWILDQVFKMFGHRGILDDFWTVIGKTIYLPGKKTIADYSEEQVAGVLSHEIQHIVDLCPNYFVYVWNGLKYLLWKPHRKWTEARGYFRSMEALIYFDGYLSDGVKEFFIEMMSGKAYFNMMKEDEAQAWLTRASLYLLSLNAEKKLPLTRKLKSINGITDNF